VPAYKATKTDDSACLIDRRGYEDERSRAVTPRTRVPQLTAAGGDGTEDWWSLLARFSAPLEKTQMAPQDNDAEFAGVITHPDPGVEAPARLTRAIGRRRTA
jgi:hypothetical protein